MNRKWLIKNGLILDGTGTAPRKADLLLKDGIIAEIGDQLFDKDSKVLDASGCVITPGFIDIHRHCDGELLLNPEFGKLELAQGITTVITGNCGMSLAPSADKTRESMYRYYAPCLGTLPPNLKAADMSDFFRQAERKNLPVNIGTLIGMGSIRIAVKGFEKSPFTKSELETAIEMIDEAFDAGALGLSTGLMYLPECYSSFEEMKTLWIAAADKGGMISCHIRGEGNSLVKSVKEIINLGKASGLPFNISHFKSVGLKNWQKEIYRAAELLEKSDTDFSVDFYPYAGGATTLLSLVPPSLTPGSPEEFLRKLALPKGTALLREEILKEHTGWDNMVLDIGWDKILVNGLKQSENQNFQGKNLAEITKIGNFHDEAQCLAELLKSENGQAGAILMSMDPKDVDYVASLPYSMVISDSLYGNKRDPHPRLYGSFPKIIEDFVCKRNILTLPEAIRKMTGLPAQRLGLKKRGFLKEGYIGDVNVFESKKVHTCADYGTPCIRATGMRAVFVNGQCAFRNETVCGTYGKVIRKNFNR